MLSCWEERLGRFHTNIEPLAIEQILPFIIREDIYYLQRLGKVGTFVLVLIPHLSYSALYFPTTCPWTYHRLQRLSAIFTC